MSPALFDYHLPPHVHMFSVCCPFLIVSDCFWYSISSDSTKDFCAGILWYIMKLLLPFFEYFANWWKERFSRPQNLCMKQVHALMECSCFKCATSKAIIVKINPEMNADANSYRYLPELKGMIRNERMYGALYRHLYQFQKVKVVSLLFQIKNFFWYTFVFTRCSVSTLA